MADHPTNKVRASAEKFAVRFAESDKSWDSLVSIFQEAMDHGAKRKVASFIRAAKKYGSDNSDELNLYLTSGAVIRAVCNIAEGKDPSDTGYVASSPKL